MKKISLLFSVLVALFALSGCMKVPHEEVPGDDDRAGSKPIDTDVPANFDWKTTTDVTVTITVNDQYNDQYKYSVMLYLENPLTDSEAPSVKGVVTSSTETTTLTIPSGVKTLYACQTDPLSRRSVRIIKVDGTNLSVDFSAGSAKAFTSKANGVKFFSGERATVQSVPVTPADAIAISGSQNKTFDANKSYVVRSGETFSGSINFPDNGKCNFFIEGTWDYSNKGDVDVERTIIVLQAKGVIKTTNSKGNLEISDNASLQIAKDANLTLGSLDFDDNATLINNGTLNVTTLEIDGNVENNGVIVVGSFEADGDDDSSVILNNGIITIDDPNTCKLEDVTINNNCLIQVNPDNKNTNIFFEGVTLNNGVGSQFLCEKLFLGKGDNDKSKDDDEARCFINLAENSILYVKNQLHMSSDNHKITGAGSKKSLVRAGDVSLTGQLSVTYKAITIEYGKHSNKSYKADGDVEMVKIGETDFEIPKNECSGAENIPGGGSGTEEDQDKDQVITCCHTYVFEDNWPSIGDYDMNDAVIQLNNYTSSVKNKTIKLNFRLLAVGATFNIGAGIQFDGYSSNDIEEVSLIGTIANNLERGKDHPVVMLFNDAHKILGFNEEKRIPINTSSTKFPPKDFSLEIKFKTVDAVKDFTVSDLNVFIYSGNISPDNTRKEIHMRGYTPTEMMIEGIFGTRQDNSLNSGVYYKSIDNFVWGIIIPTNFAYPKESHNIQTAYLNFIDWINSNGTANELWYETPVDEKVIKIE